MSDRFRISALTLFLVLGVLGFSHSAHAFVFGSIEGDVSADWIAEADFETPGFSTSEIGYRQTEAEFRYTQPLSRCWGLVLSSGFMSTHIDWDANPDFREKDFFFITAGLGAYTLAIPDWVWKVNVSAAVDPDHFDHSDYMVYRGVLWGQYAYGYHCFCEMNLHIGLVAMVGLEKTSVLPILGADFMPNDSWKINLVFPLKIGVDYYITDCLTVGTAVRSFLRRHRVDNSENIPKGVFEYRNIGIEGVVKYTWCWLDINIHGGFALEHELKSSNRFGHNSTHYIGESAFYGGGSLSVKF